MNNSSTWRTSRRSLLGLAAAATAGMALAACGSATNTSGGGGGSSTPGGSGGDKPMRADNILYVAGLQWGTPTNFNPVSTSLSFGVTNSSMPLVYETLLQFNQLDGKLNPGLAKELKEVDKNNWELPLNDGTKFSDGSDLTADDVAFTFELGKTAKVNFSTVWNYVDSITAKDPKTVAIKLKASPYNPLIVKDQLTQVPIMPKAVWSKIAADKVVTEPNMTPIGSGPYTLEKADQTQVIYTKSTSYWGASVFGDPKPEKIIHPIFKSNNDGDVKLQKGEIDASQQFTAEIWKMWANGGHVSTYLKAEPYYLPGNMPSLIFNVAKPGLNNPMVRKAIAYAINYADIAEKAMSKYSATVKASYIIPQGSEEKFFDSGAVDKNGWTQDAAKATEILEKELKCTKGGDGIYSLPDGTRLGPWTLITPTGWTDWNASCDIIAKSLKTIGIDVKTNFPQAPTMIASMQNGEFDMVHFAYSAIGASSPWSRLRDVLDSRNVAPVGKPAFWNYGRFTNDKVGPLLDQVAGESDAAKQKDLYTQLDNIVRDNVPAIPVMYRPSQFFEFNYSTWTGFPTQDNSYAPPTFNGAGIGWLFKIKKVGS